MMKQKSKVVVSGGFNPEHLRKYPELAQFRVALGMDQDAFEKYIERTIIEAAAKELGRRKKEQAMREYVVELKKIMAVLKRRFPAEYDAVVAARPRTSRQVIDEREKRWKADEEYKAFVRHEKAVRAARRGSR